MPEDLEIGGDRIALDKYEMDMVGKAGLARHKIVTDRRPDWYFGAGQTELTSHQRYELGAIGEFALSVMLNLAWRPYVGRAHMPDVGGIIECRTVQPHKLNNINIKANDKLGVPFVLVRWTRPNVFDAIGWQDSQWIVDHCPRYEEGDRAWWCEPDFFLSMSELRRWINARPVRTIIVRNRDPGAVQR